jgi:NhaA family Na+:H+ antiporter
MTPRAPQTPPTWLNSDRFLARNLARPVQRFLHVEAAGGIALLAGTIIALVWANSPWADSYHDLWETRLAFDLGGHVVADDLRHWVNDGLMALFFFVVGLEIKQELSEGGHLATVKDATLPAIAALGGMVVPAAIYAVINAGGDGSAGWGIPMATDIAFALGVVALLGSRVPTPLKVMLLALAIVDDIGAIVVIAVFYSDDIHAGWALAALAGLALVAVLARIRVWYRPVYAVLGFAVWFATFESGVHATIAGVALGLLAPARPLLPDSASSAITAELSEDHDVTVAEVRRASFRLRESVPVAERMQDALHPWTSYVVIPVFALANAGVVLSRDVLADAAASPITIGVVVGLVVGKFVGITGAVALATRLKLGRLPEGVSMRHVRGIAALAGIGFTVSIFISGLAFDDGGADEAKIGVLVASALAAVVGTLLLRRAAVPLSSDEPSRAGRRPRPGRRSVPSAASR